jgi:protein-tyrosine-phosphatase
MVGAFFAKPEVGVDITGEHPKPIDSALLREVDLVVTLGREARVDVPPGTGLENWDTDEPSERVSRGSSGCGWSATTSPTASSGWPLN